MVTGGNSGVGKATATALAAAGARTVITARSRARGEEAVADIRRASGSDQVDLVVFDLADLASVRDGAAELLDRYDRHPRAGQQRRAGAVATAPRPGRRVRGHLRHQPPGAVPPHPAPDRPADRLGPGPGGQRGLDRPPLGPARAGLRRSPVRAGTTGACRPTAGPSWPTSCSPPSWPGGCRGPGSRPTPSTRAPWPPATPGTATPPAFWPSGSRSSSRSSSRPSRGPGPRCTWPPRPRWPR